MKIKLSGAWFYAIIQMAATWTLIFLPFGMRVDIAIDRTIAIVFLMLALTMVAGPNRHEAT